MLLICNNEKEEKLVIEAALTEMKKIGEEYLNEITYGKASNFISHNLDVERTFALLKQLDLRRDHRSVSNLENAILYRENIIESEVGREYYEKLTPSEHRQIRKQARMKGPLQLPEKEAHQI